MLSDMRIAKVVPLSSRLAGATPASAAAIVFWLKELSCLVRVGDAAL